MKLTDLIIHYIRSNRQSIYLMSLSFFVNIFFTCRYYIESRDLSSSIGLFELLVFMLQFLLCSTLPLRLSLSSQKDIYKSLPIEGWKLSLVDQLMMIFIGFNFILSYSIMNIVPSEDFGLNIIYFLLIMIFFTNLINRFTSFYPPPRNIPSPTESRIKFNKKLLLNTLGLIFIILALITVLITGIGEFAAKLVNLELTPISAFIALFLVPLISAIAFNFKKFRLPISNEKPIIALLVISPLFAYITKELSQNPNYSLIHDVQFSINTFLEREYFPTHLKRTMYGESFSQFVVGRGTFEKYKSFKAFFDEEESIICSHKNKCVNENLLSIALKREVGKNRNAILDDLIKDKKFFHSIVGKNQNSMLALASRKCEPAAVRSMLQEKVAIDLKNKLGQTPLMLAIKKSCWPVITQLYQAGANVNAVDLKGKSVISYAKDASEDKDLELYLKMRGARLPASDK